MASSPSLSSEAQLKSEIARLTASINQHKAQQQSSYGPPRSNIYINPTYRPSTKYVRPGLTASSQQLSHQSGPSTSTSTMTPSTGVKEVVLNGVAFESSKRSLVRKDHMYSIVAKPPSNNPGSVLPPTSTYPRKHGHPTAQRIYKPKSVRSRNMTLMNYRRPYQSVFTASRSLASSDGTYLRARRIANKSRKYSNKPCPRFTTTGACNRGLTCMYQHDPSKIAICWNFLQGNCPNTAETCNLSHDPTPERTPLCLHFSNKGRCTREKCPFPHVNVGMRHGICRDFAVLGYCEKGLDCDKKHVRECPDFAENGTCTTKGCKLPHVIRANRNRKATSLSQTSTVQVAEAPETDSSSLQPKPTVEDAQLGDEFISLTFNESSDEDSEDSDEEEANTEEDESEIEESSDPNEAVHIDVEET